MNVTAWLPVAPSSNGPFQPRVAVQLVTAPSLACAQRVGPMVDTNGCPPRGLERRPLCAIFGFCVERHAMPVTGVLALQARAKTDAAADRKHQELLDRIRASLEASRAIVERLQRKDRVTPGGARQASTS
jgi:hypothetical protein